MLWLQSITKDLRIRLKNEVILNTNVLRLIASALNDT